MLMLTLPDHCPAFGLTCAGQERHVESVSCVGTLDDARYVAAAISATEVALVRQSATEGNGAAAVGMEARSDTTDTPPRSLTRSSFSSRDTDLSASAC